MTAYDRFLSDGVNFLELPGAAKPGAAFIDNYCLSLKGLCQSATPRNESRFTTVNTVSISLRSYVGRMVYYGHGVAEHTLIVTRILLDRLIEKGGVVATEKSIHHMLLHAFLLPVKRKKINIIQWPIWLIF
jgi:hypothetical protein